MNGLSFSDVRRVVQTTANSIGNQNGPINSQPVNYQGQQPFSLSNQPQQKQPISNQRALPGYSPVSNTPTIRIASFNIEVFGDSKARKQNVMQLLGEVVRQFDIVAIQEIRTKDPYYIQKFLRNHVNQPGKTIYDARVSKRLGRTVSQEQYAFVFNTATINVSPKYEFVMQDHQDALHREPHVALFQTKLAPPDQAFTFWLMNIHTDPDEVPQELDALYGAYQAMQRVRIDNYTEDDVILLGDLNTAVPAKGPRTQNVSGRKLLPKDLYSLAKLPGIYPLIHETATNTAGNRLHDNLLVSRYTTTEFTGRAGVYDFPGIYGLSYDDAKQVSDHLPVWGEFSAYESGSIGRVAQVPGKN